MLQTAVFVNEQHYRSVCLSLSALHSFSLTLSLIIFLQSICLSVSVYLLTYLSILSASVCLSVCLHIRSLCLSVYQCLSTCSVLSSFFIVRAILYSCNCLFLVRFVNFPEGLTCQKNFGTMIASDTVIWFFSGGGFLSLSGSVAERTISKKHSQTEHIQLSDCPLILRQQNTVYG